MLELADGRRVLLEADREKVAWSQQLLAELTDLLGPGCVRAALTLGTKRRDAEPARRGPSRSGFPRRLSRTRPTGENPHWSACGVRLLSAGQSPAPVIRPQW